MLSLLTRNAPCPCCAYAHAGTMLSLSPLLALRRGARASQPPDRADPESSPEFHFDGAIIVDPRDGRKQSGLTVITKLGRIVEIAPTASKRPARDAREVDVRGKFIVPGYNDMHSHVLELPDPAGSLALMLAEGVTGFRQMSGSPALLARKRAGTLPIGRAAPHLHETPGSILTPFNAGSPDAVRAEVRRQKEQGADFVKMGLVNPDAFFAALDEGRRVGIPVLGHLQEGTDALEATAAGFRSVEHLGPGSTMWVCCSHSEAELRAESYRREYIKAPPFKIPFLERIVMKRLQKMLVNPSAFSRPADVDRLQRAIGSFSESKAHAMAERFVDDGSWQCPTLVRLRTQEYADAPEYQQDEMLDYLPAKSVARWREVTETWKALPSDIRRTFRDAYPRQQALTKLLSDAGVRMIAGTDGGSYLSPGLTLRQEFKELAEAGLSPLRILQMATVNAADYLGRSETMGTVEIGKDADMVLLDADPLARVENMHNIAGVVRAGFYYAARDLAELKSTIAANRGYLN